MDFLEFLKDSKTAFHAAKKTKEILLENGFIELNETDDYKLEKGKNYFLTRNNSSVIAFQIPSDIKNLGFNITAAHLDSPTFKLKPNFELDFLRYQKLNTEVYGGPIFYSWMDRPLDIAGRVLVKEGNKIETKLIEFNKAMTMIPSLSIHYNREANSGFKFNPQEDMLPILADNDIEFGDLLDKIANKLNVTKEDILSYDLYLALLDRGTYAGINNEFIMAPQIDNLECSYVALNSMINSKPANGTINVMALFDNEEIGSRTRQGADSNLLDSTLKRIADEFDLSESEYSKALASSFFISMDNAQGFHPNYASKYDQTNRCYMNDGVVIKAAARGSYTSDGYSIAIFKLMCENSDAKYQFMTNRSDIPGGGTLGAINLSHLSIPSVDIGFAQIAMHSSMETAGALDIVEMEKVIKYFYSRHLIFNGDGKVVI